MFGSAKTLLYLPGKDRHREFADGPVNVSHINNKSSSWLNLADHLDGQIEKY